MKRIPIVQTAWLMLLLAAIASSSCSDKIKSVLVLTNERPIVRITAAPIDSSETCDPDPVRSCYSLTLRWSGYDADGRVDYYLYAIDPTDRDTTWERTRENEKRLQFRSGTVISDVLARDYHTFVIKAVDNRGAAGPLVHRSFFSFTEAPTVLIENPLPRSLLTWTLTPSVRFIWSGDDPDGVFTDKPVKYKYLLLGPGSEFHRDTAIASPSSLLRYYAPGYTTNPLGPWVGWDSTSAETTEARFTNLVPGQDYAFVVLAFDEAGAYSPVINLDTNLIRFRVGFAATLGPKITVFNEFFDYLWRGGYCACAQTEVFIEVPARTPVNFNWFAEPPEGAAIRTYRWALDIQDVSDSTARSNEETDWAHWSSPSVNVRSVRFPGFPDTIPGEPEIHRLYIEAEDNVGLVSLAIVRFRVVAATLERPLLVVKDHRYPPDMAIRNSNPPCTQLPVGLWPMAAELDTFLFAVGGVPYRCYDPWRPGTMSTPGIFNGYPWDSMGTRLGRRDLTIRLSDLGRYRHLVWITDGLSATFNRDGTHPGEPMTSLRYMTSPGRFNTLGAYIKQGGKVWFVGGGAGVASTIAWDDPANNSPSITFSINSLRRELVPGRMMYDFAGWRSEFRVNKVRPIRIRRFAGRHEGAPDPTLPYTSYLHELPSLMEVKTPESDPYPPARSNSGEFYQSTVSLEFLQLENRVLEVVNDDPENPIEGSTLDTLYDATADGLPVVPIDNKNNVVMSYFHGAQVPQGFVFTGFSIWNFKRAQSQGLVDFVLRRIWGLQRSPQPSRAVRAEFSRGRPAMPTPGVSRPTGVGRGRVTRLPSTVRHVASPLPRD